jgi:hypothetical protein
VTITEGNSGTTVATFTVTRTGGTAAFSVNYATADGTATVADNDYAATTGTLSFGSGVNTQTISVTINGDSKVEGNETLSTPEQRCIGLPEQKCISDAGKKAPEQGAFSFDIKLRWDGLPVCPSWLGVSGVCFG